MSGPSKGSITAKLFGQLVDPPGFNLYLAHFAFKEQSAHYRVAMLPEVIDMVQDSGTAGSGLGHDLAHLMFPAAPAPGGRSHCMCLRSVETHRFAGNRSIRVIDQNAGSQ